MQETLLRVFVVGLGLLMCPKDDPGVEEWDGIVNKDMQRHEEKLLREEEKLDQEMPPVSEKIHTDKNETEHDRNFHDEQKSDQNVTEKDKLLESEGHGSNHELLRGRSTAKSDPSLPDIGTLNDFYAKYVQESSQKKWRKDEFLEGFANDLLDAMRTICGKNGSMVIEDFQMLSACNIIVPLTPPKPFSFHIQLCNHKGRDFSNMPVCGQIKLLENKKTQDCPCQTSDADEDMVCLLHSDHNENVRTEITEVCDGFLCSKNTPFLSKSLVSRWFQSTIKQAWRLISHKYEFELNIHYIDAPGALVIRFKSGKKITFSMNPVVTFNDDAYFFITPWSSSDADTFWRLSLTSYEDHLLEHLSKRLPENACHIQALEIARFLHKRQTAMTGSSALKDFHFKTALMHLLLTTDPRHWNANCVDSRLRDLLSFIERSLEKKVLKHILIGSSLTEVIELPAELIRAKPVNLFYPLVVHNCMYRNAMMHFQEMLRNAYMMVDDYRTQCHTRRALSS
uniref:Inositol 1,4,5-trisphosphate receptor-interacting protein n=1 Tax=Astatotilapia calliptera TaxID=8154 RepID=A0A3P8QBL6_ASTCA